MRRTKKPKSRGLPKKAKNRKLLFVTSNRHKFDEVQALLRPFGIGLQRREMDFVENESVSIEREAVNKAKQAFARFKKPLIVEDTGVYFTAYRNFPGTQPKRMFEALGYEGYFKLLSGKKRSAYVETVICHITSPNRHHTFTGNMRGGITKRVYLPRKDLLAYEHIFRPRGKRRVMAQLSRGEKNAISHRAKAARKLAKYLIGK